jgi:hypothetical protein
MMTMAKDKPDDYAETLVLAARELAKHIIEIAEETEIPDSVMMIALAKVLGPTVARRAKGDNDKAMAMIDHWLKGLAFEMLSACQKERERGTEH